MADAEKIAHRLGVLKLEDLLTPEQKAETQRVLKEMADARDRAAFEARFIRVR